MKFMITGGAGFIGSHLVDALIAQSHQIIIVDNLSSGQQENINAQAKFYKINVNSPRLREVFTLEQPDVVVHLASIGMGLNQPINPLAVLQTNVSGTLNLLEAARIHNTRKIIYASSAVVYGNNPKQPLSEQTHPLPNSHYALTKLAVEEYLRFYHINHALEFTALRYPSVYGPRQNLDNHYALVRYLLNQMRHHQPLSIYGTQKQTHNLVYIDDIVNATCHAIERGGGQIINVGATESISTHQLFMHIKDVTKYQHQPTYLPPQTGYIHKMQLDNDRAKQVLDWQAEIDIEQGLAKMLTIMRSEK